jgi:hypothetical protein
MIGNVKRERSPCPYRAGRPEERSDKHDAYLCRACDAWCELECDDADCPYCAGRPEKPSMTTGLGRGILGG